MRSNAFRRLVLVALASVVVLSTTYALILPALTLDEKEAASQGGVGVQTSGQDADSAGSAGTDAKSGADNESNTNAGSDTDSALKSDSGEEPSSNDAKSTAGNANNSTGSKIKKTVITASGETWEITVTYSPDTGIPAEGVEPDVSEVLPDDQDDAKNASANDMSYEDYVAYTERALGMEKGSADYIRLFDIKIVAKDDHSVKYQPNEGTSVDVSIELADAEDGQDLSVVHFADGESKGEPVDAETDGQTVSFAAEGFSVYSIVDAPEPVIEGNTLVSNLSELAQRYNYESGFYLSYGSTQYFTNTLNKNSAFAESPSMAEASRWYFEPVEGSENTYVIYTYVNEEKQYMQNTSGNLMGLTAELSSAVSFVLDSPSDSKFYFKKNNENKWLQHSNGGGGIRFWSDKNNATNSQISLTYAADAAMDDDPYDLDGKTYGIAYHDDSATSAALTAEGKTVKVSNADQRRLSAQDMLMRPDVLDHDGILLVAEGSDIQEWTFHNVEKNKYYITTEVEGVLKYLTIENGEVTLNNEPDETYSVITATPGIGSNSGKWHFTVSGYSLNLPSGSSNGFNSETGSGDTTWMNLVEKSVLTDDDFNLYTAKKVSVSDTDQVYSGQQVVLYTRIWNDTTKKYEFYAVDHDGSLVRCYDTGDNIEWIGTQVNTALWDFTEGMNADGSPSYYYWLRNTQYGNYLIPQAASGKVSYDSTEDMDFNASVNLNGRRYGESYTTVIAWDDAQYAYSGLKTENGHVVPCPLSEAEDFYFAIVNPRQEAPEVTTVATVDSNAYGITMKMIDFNNEVVDGRDSKQTEIMGTTGGGKGLLTTGLSDNYPAVLSNGKSLSELFSGATQANHLFLQSIYNESGYFEYDSTQNFAHLNSDGTFTVYDQIGAITGGEEHKNTREHGQFMPYNDISGEKGFAIDSSGNVITNQTDVNAKELSDLDARKGESMYLIGNNNIGIKGEEGGVDYYFGMEMEASFTQTANGLDAWGHDIIFEFSGDDDFWLYVDGELVIDLGGVHSAQSGSVNFRTGEIKSSNGNSTLYDTFKAHYVSRGMSSAEVTAKLNELFEQKTVDGNTVYVFKDYSNHTMRMFYMERGAGASNLHMRFNLAAVTPGTVELSKKLSGTDSESNSLIEFPYQIYYRQEADGGDTYHLLTDTTEDAEGNATNNVTYKDSTRAVTYQSGFTPAGGSKSYDNVFFLKAGETAVISLPDDTIDYYIVECGINPDVYDKVSANGTEITGKETVNVVGTTNRKDYQTSAATTSERPAVEYDNHVSEGAMRTLSITKKLYDTDGMTELTYPENETLFTFRLYLGNENANASNLPLANMYPYLIKDAEGHYCKWDAEQQKLVSLGDDVTTYEALQQYFTDNDWTDAQKESVIFKTSMNGSISKIPAGYTVEVRDLIVGSQYMVEERDWEIPKGYTRRDADGYARVDKAHEIEQNAPYTGTMTVNEDPEIEVRNQKGWGLTAEKIWTDKDFMASHDDIYFAIYVGNDFAKIPYTTTSTGEDGEVVYTTQYKDCVRVLKSTDSELYFYFGDLYNGTQGTTHEFSDYVVKEVTLEGSETVQLDADGYVTNLSSFTVTPIKENETLTVGGTPVGGSHQDEYTYQVSYKVGEPTGKNENIRTDTVTNSRPGIEIYKTDWTGGWKTEGGKTTLSGALAGAKFTLKDSDGDDVAASEYTSGSDGLVTIAYLSEGTYTLTETEAPKGYAVTASLTITVDPDNTVTVSGADESCYTVTHDNPAMAATITVKNRSHELKAVKVNESDKAIEGVHFALYRQVTDTSGNPVKDYLPMTGFDDLVTGETGVIPKITFEDLAAGTYYLTETKAAPNYDLLEEDICFTIGKDGTVTINTEAYKAWLKTDTSVAGKVSYTIKVINGEMKQVSFKKVDIASTSSALSGAKFDLYKVVDGTREEAALFSGLISGSDGMLSVDGTTVFKLPFGTYHLVETEAPAGYNLKTGPVVVTVSASGVTYDDGTSLSASSQGVKYYESSKTYTLLITNTTGYELPVTGGIGTHIFMILGVALILSAGITLTLRRRRAN